MNQSDADRLETALNGKEIARLMANPGYDVAVKTVREFIVAGWAKAQNTDDRERAWYLLQALDALQIGLKGFAANGEFDHFTMTGRK